MENTPPNRPQMGTNKKIKLRKKKKRNIQALINNSGKGGDYPVVKLVTDKFNWGAFLFTWIWGCYYKKWITLLIIPACIIPILPLILSIWFGIAGNKWAWQNKRYKSIQDFHNTQKNWAIAGTILLIIPLAMSFFTISNLLEQVEDVMKSKEYQQMIMNLSEDDDKGLYELNKRITSDILKQYTNK